MIVDGEAQVHIANPQSSPRRRVRHPLKFTLRPDLGWSIPMAIA